MVRLLPIEGGGALNAAVESSSPESRNYATQKRTILIVDDDLRLCSLIAQFLTSYNFTIHSVHDGRAGVVRALGGNYDLILLDVMLPFQNGFEVLQEIRKRSRIPVIMLTARAEQEDRVAGLNSGADDYLPKPFSPQELLARIRAVLRRTEGSPDSGIFQIGDICLNTRARTVQRCDEELELTTFEFDILSILMRLAGRVVSRDEIAAILYNRDSTPFERSIDVHVSHLRRKIDTDGRVRIRTVRGAGYVFVISGA